MNEVDIGVIEFVTESAMRYSAIVVAGFVSNSISIGTRIGAARDHNACPDVIRRFIDATAMRMTVKSNTFGIPKCEIASKPATTITAGIGEELFYRQWLQTRLEAGLGAWAGIAVTTVAFALMHLASHSTRQPLLDVATVLVSQGPFGLLAGILWWRYRNLLAVVVMHLLSNGWSVLAYMLG